MTVALAIACVHPADPPPAQVEPATEPVVAPLLEDDMRPVLLPAVEAASGGRGPLVPRLARR